MRVVQAMSPLSRMLPLRLHPQAMVTSLKPVSGHIFPSHITLPSCRHPPSPISSSREDFACCSSNVTPFLDPSPPPPPPRHGNVTPAGAWPYPPCTRHSSLVSSPSISNIFLRDAVFVGSPLIPAVLLYNATRENIHYPLNSRRTT
jgi:hypothetical protein